MGGSINWKLWIGLLISALFTYLAFRNVNLAEVWGVIRSSDPFFLYLFVLALMLQYVMRALRWGILLEPVKATGFLNRLNAVLVGFAANCVLPARLGEFIRADSLGRSERMSGSAAFGTVVVERLFDGFTLLLFLFISLLVTPFPDEWKSVAVSLRGTGLFLLVLYLSLIAFLIGFKRHTDKFVRIIERLLRFLPRHLLDRIISLIRKFSSGLVPLKKPSRWVLAILYSLILWFLGLYQVYVTEQSIGLALAPSSTFLVLAMASLGVMIPSAPGFVGTYHLSVQIGLLFYGTGREEALSAAIILHAAFFIPTILFGLIAFVLSQGGQHKARDGP